MSEGKNTESYTCVADSSYARFLSSPDKDACRTLFPIDRCLDESQEELKARNSCAAHGNKGWMNNVPAKHDVNALNRLSDILLCGGYIRSICPVGQGALMGLSTPLPFPYTQTHVKDAQIR